MGYKISFHEISVSVVVGTCGQVMGIAVHLNVNCSY
jgi:hypothetical protein